MQPALTDLERTVVYSRDRWQMRLVPWALLLIALGLVFIIVEKAPLGASLGLGAVEISGLSIIMLIGYFLLFQIFEGRAWLLRLLCLLIFLGVLYFFFFGSGSGASLPHKSTGRIDVAGGVLMLAGLGYIAYALYRHWMPGEPILMLSPAGVRLHWFWLRDVEVPWARIDAIEHHKAFASPLMWGTIDTPTVKVSRETFDRLIETKRNFLADPHWRHMFMVGEEQALIILHPAIFALKPEDISAPLTARWNAFHSAPPVPFDAVPAAEPVVLGLWHDERSWTQALTFGVPLALVLALLLYAIAFPP